MMANLIAMQSNSIAAACPASGHSFSASSSCSAAIPQIGKPGIRPFSRYRENGRNYLQFRRAQPSLPVLKAARDSSEWADSSSSSNGTNMREERAMTPLTGEEEPQKHLEGLVPFGRTSFCTLSKDMAMGLVLQAATATGWTTGSGLEGPAITREENTAEDEKLKFPSLSKSPRRRMRVAFTCNKCGERTTRAINPHAYSDGTVFVQCKGCDVFHKLVDNLNLFHEMNGKIYRGYDIPWYANDQPYDFLNAQYPIDDQFPRF